MTPELEEKFRACPNLPSPPTVAIQIIQLAREEEIDLKKFTDVLNCDPALASKILRTANSPLYPYPKKIENLHQAAMILGLNASISLALSFSLMKSLQATKGTGLDYVLYWKRAVLAGTACRALGRACKIQETEELYLASLLQDLGMLAFDQVFPDLYATHMGEQANHTSIIAHEHQSLGLTHGAVGSWLLKQWNFPDRLRVAIAASDDPSRIPPQDERATFAYCVSLSGKIAEIFLHEAQDDYLQMVKEQARVLLNLSPETLMDVLETIQGYLPETEKIFETDLQTWNDPQSILESARESLLARNLQTLKQMEELQINSVTMEAQFHHLVEIHRHDPLTGVLSRAYLDKYLESSFEQAIANEECLTLVFGDLDKFKSVNDTYGHQAGDAILQSASRLLQSKLRSTDMVGRYGGEEFVLILPKAPPAAAIKVCERILTAFRESSHEMAQDQHRTVTISLGIATHTPENPYTDVIDLLHDADKAVYYSKTHGGNRHTPYETMKTNQPA